ncbi:MAG: hypothetical protein F2813_05085 [Actinobacteria bacterium]|uniref:Unannotated protein n=1 Tax=freshwater metagenome TaxID=449393 RepID=A0A6J5ZRE1_9ZZZZ|nr:hypothetical protein [Actinomycetota bacterium]
MTALWYIVEGLVTIVVIVAVALVLVRVATRLLSRPRSVGRVEIGRLQDSTHTDKNGAVLSVQSADLQMDSAALEAIWTPMHLERLARTYWRFLTRCTLGLIRVQYTDNERFVVFLRRPFVLLAFRKPEYRMDGERGVVRWWIERGVLVAAPGVDSDGYLEIDVSRKATETDGRSTLHVDIEIANYYPRIAASIAQWAYAATQSRIHVLVTYGFLRSIARGDLAESRTGRFAQIDDLSSPVGPRPRDRGAAGDERPASSAG